jgi:uncharacterized protein YjbI with pentapeptide repeats
MITITEQHIDKAIELAEAGGGLGYTYDQSEWCGTSCCVMGFARIVAGVPEIPEGPRAGEIENTPRAQTLARLMGCGASGILLVMRGVKADGSIDLSGADLSNADLRDADLSDASLRGADLRYADLRGVNLRGADLRGAHLSGADLSGAHLRGADLSGAHLRGVNLSDADLRGADLSDASLRGADLRYASLRDADLRGADLSDADLSYAYRNDTDAPITGWSVNECRMARE